MQVFCLRRIEMKPYVFTGLKRLLTLLAIVSMLIIPLSSGLAAGNPMKLVGAPTLEGWAIL
jgi:hypothetical protein